VFFASLILNEIKVIVVQYLVKLLAESHKQCHSNFDFFKCLLFKEKKSINPPTINPDEIISAWVSS